MSDEIISQYDYLDIQKMDEDQLVKLADEIRKKILVAVSSNGGHLSSNLGVIELTIALLKSFDLESDDLLFDVGHGAASFDINVGRRAIDEGFLPDLIGTDLHKDSYRIAGKLEDVMTKILACSVPLSAVIESVTGRARRVLGIEDYNTGCDGKIADLTLFRLDNTPRTFVDSVGNKINTENGIVAMYSIANGKLYICKERENGNI